MIFEATLFLILLYVTYSFFNRDPPDYPPGPFRIPIIGRLLNDNEGRTVKLQKKYGDLILDKIGSRFFLTICDYKLSKEAFSKTELANRPELDAVNEYKNGRLNGISFANGENWKSNRRFILHYLRDHGMGKSYLEKSIHREAKEIIAEFKRLNGSTTNLTFLNFASLNIIWQMIASKRYEVNDPILDKMQILSKEFFDSFAIMFLLDSIQLFKNIIPKRMTTYLMKRQNYFKFFDEMKMISKPLIDEHKKNLDTSNPKDLMDFYAMEKKNPKYLKEEFISDDDLLGITLDMFNAGADTVSLTLRWAILFMAQHPHIQTKMKEEIDKVVPKDMLPGYEHRIQLPYCEAVIHEVLRKSSLAASGGLRMNTDDIYLGGYRIPKGTIIMAATTFMHHSSRYWTNPNEFNPDRFLDENGKFCVPKEGFLPFGIGKRQCIGEGLARSEIYIFMTAIFQNFSFSAPLGKSIDTRFSKNGFAFHIPVDQEVVVHARN